MNFLKEVIRGTEHFIGEEDLEKRLKEDKPLRVKLGVDPTRPDLTFGHMVVFNKLRQFQEAGHQAVLIIGDYTAMIGDPSGRSSTRPVLTEKEVEENAQTYLDQAFKVLDKEKTEVRFNSEWFSKMSFGDTLALARRMTVARMLERDDFSKRYKSQEPISIVEFLYPLVQGYDSVVLESDIELGGSDQLFNMLVGRSLQKEEGKLGQAVATLPLLVGLDGVRKMSKSYDNYISFMDPPKEMFGKIMSINDDVMWDYYQLLLLESDEQIAELKQIHPMEAKKQLASRLTSKFHPNMFITLTYGIFDENQHTLTLARAGHELPLLITPSSEITAKAPPYTTQPIETEGMALCMVPSDIFDECIEEHTFPFTPGDTLHLYTDGATETPNQQGEEFSTKQLIDILNHTDSQSPEKLNQAIISKLKTFSDGVESTPDDITLLTLHHKTPISEYIST